VLFQPSFDVLAYVSGFLRFFARTESAKNSDRLGGST
jgi:hypothetical protein